MEQVLRHQIESRITSLQEAIKTSQALLTKCQTGFTEEELIRAKVELRHCLENTEKSLNFYMDKSKDSCPIIVELATKTQTDAEKLQIEIESISCSYSLLNQSKAGHSSKLPKLDLIKFKGDILLFTEFWDSFKSAVDSKSISEAEKLAYLLGSLEGPAKEALQGLNATNENYSIAVDILHKRYGVQTLLVDAHYEALENIKPASTSPAECRSNLNKVENHLRILESMGENIQNKFLRGLITRKFPDNVLYQLNLLTPIDRDVLTLREGLEKIITALERSGNKETLTGEETSKAATTSSLHIQAGTGKRPRREFSRNETQVKKKPRKQCAFCNGSHFSDTCRRYGTLLERRKQLKGKCYSCFGTGHNIKNCRRKNKCFFCKTDQHNTALCPKKLKLKNKNISTEEKGSEGAKPTPEAAAGEERDIQLSECNTSVNSKSFLQTATAKISNNIKEIPCRILLDCGSQRSYATTRIMTRLGLETDNSDRLVIYTFGSDTPQEISSPSVNINITTRRGVVRQVRVNVIPYITNRIPVNSVTLDKKYAVDVPADEDTLGDRIDVLIGNDYYFSFMRNEWIKIQDNLFLINTDFGWIISGNTNSDTTSDNILSVVTYCQCHEPTCPYFAEPDLPLRNIDMKFLWSLETIGISDSPKATREEEAVKFFNDTTKYEAGRYLVKWPWIQYPPELPTNLGLAYGRLKSLLQRSNRETLKTYNTILQEQLSAKVIEVVEQQSMPINQVNPPIHYLPHHIVQQEGKKGRIVYDASAKLKDQKSLNECLYRGPSMLEDLIGLLLKFRTNAIGITADVEKAFLQIGLQEEDKDVTRFLWLKDINKGLSEDNLLHMRFCRVPFGVISSPFLLTATIRNHITKTNKSLLKNIADKCYVDNLLTGTRSLKEAEELFYNTQKTFKELSMNIRDWVSNSEELMKIIPKEQRAENTDQCKVLGLMWNVKNDTLELKLSDEIFQEHNTEEKITKRDILRTLARIFDPHGFIAPLVLPIKMIFQDLCVLKLKWDRVLPEELMQKWKTILQKLKAVKEVKIKRYLEQGNGSSDKRYELHTFADASKNSFAAVTYVRVVQETITVSFIMSKARITGPEDKDELKIPRLELLACLIGSRLTRYISENIDMPIDKQFLWTDSRVVLSWLKTSKLLPPFVSRRVAEIKKDNKIEFCYINTNENPADLATRPELWDQKKRLWFDGPSFLTTPVENWPLNRHIDDHQTSFFVGETLDTIDGPEMTLRGYETELPEYLAGGQEIDWLEDEPMDEGIKRIINLQKEYFPDEVSGKVTNLTRNLNLFADVDGVLRCKGRMTHTDWTYDAKYPILIPRDSQFTYDVIKEVHEKNYHVGASHTLNLIRQRYWIPQGKAQVQKFLKKCPQCIRHGGGPYTLPAPPALPAERVNFSKAFTFIGIDYFGPLFVETDSGKAKRWVCLFTCLAIRAVHLEVVRDLTAEECLLAIRRFIANRGIPKKIVSDNALYFKLTSEVLTAPYCTENQIKWKFIPQLAPWHGGFYERLVGLVKNCLKRTLDKHLLRDSQLTTIMKEVEAVVNARPLTAVGADLEYVLKPADFLSAGKCLELNPVDETTGTRGTKIKVDLVQGWKRGQIIMGEFKKMFLHQYLPSLREKHRYSLKQPRVVSKKEPQVGDIVQLKDDSKNRINWKVGKITSLVKGSDGHCRVAKVKVGTAELTRSIGHLYPLEVEDTECTAPPSEETRRSPSRDSPSRDRPLMSEELEVDMPPVFDLPNRETLVIPEVADQPAADTVEEDNPIADTGPSPRSSPSIEDLGSLDTSISEVTQAEVQGGRDRPVRNAAVRAREKITEWTRQLVALL